MILEKIGGKVYFNCMFYDGESASQTMNGTVYRDQTSLLLEMELLVPDNWGPL